MTKKIIQSSEPYEDQVLLLLEHMVKIKTEFADRAKEYFDLAQKNLTRAVQERDHWIKYHKLLEEEKK